MRLSVLSIPHKDLDAILCKRTISVVQNRYLLKLFHCRNSQLSYTDSHLQWRLSSFVQFVCVEYPWVYLVSVSVCVRIFPKRMKSAYTAEKSPFAPVKTLTNIWRIGETRSKNYEEGNLLGQLHWVRFQDRVGYLQPLQLHSSDSYSTISLMKEWIERQDLFCHFYKTKCKNYSKELVTYVYWYSTSLVMFVRRPQVTNKFSLKTPYKNAKRCIVKLRGCITKLFFCITAEFASSSQKVIIDFVFLRSCVEIKFSDICLKALAYILAIIVCLIWEHIS